MVRRVSQTLNQFNNGSILQRLVISITVLVICLFITVSIATASGPVSIRFIRVLHIIADAFTLNSSQNQTDSLIVLQLRIPRIIIAGLVGMALSVAGATMQSLFRNPMADPGIIGVSAGGAVGAVIAIALGLNEIFFLALPFFSFLGAIGATFLVYSIAAAGGRFSMPTLLLAGVAVTAFLNSIISAAILVVPDNDPVRKILFWLAGGLDSRAWEHVAISWIPILIGITLIFGFTRELNMLMIGDNDARSLGLRVNYIRPFLIAVSALITGTAVAVSGTIIFVGLIVPHVLRLIVGTDNRVLVPTSAIGGAIFLIAADTIARTIVQPAEIRVGIITSFIGAPFFLFLLIRNNRGTETFS
ncbi:MAG: iron chelate uptake ABC transporter family permease subunit [SAR202 cluster bacterium]|nr:iron chelate uptake ABC transporter family permease subunit [SAR202 cluster bacterium]|tara:strand:- start:540 stop:1616 length:1077 start_codon:yes stop_codon:yes gene_type:complete